MSDFFVSPIYGVIEFFGVEVKNFQEEKISYVQMRNSLTKENIFIPQMEFDIQLSSNRLRYLSSREEVESIIDNFGVEYTFDPQEDWRKKKKQLQDILLENSISQNSKVLTLLLKKGQYKPLSVGDRSFYRKVLDSFLLEISLVLNLKIEAIEDLLAQKLIFNNSSDST